MNPMKDMKKAQAIEFFAVTCFRIFGGIFTVNALACFWVISRVSSLGMFYWYSVREIAACSVFNLLLAGSLFYFSKPFAHYSRRRHEMRIDIIKSA